MREKKICKQHKPTNNAVEWENQSINDRDETHIVSGQ